MLLLLLVVVICLAHSEGEVVVVVGERALLCICLVDRPQRTDLLGEHTLADIGYSKALIDGKVRRVSECASTGDRFLLLCDISGRRLRRRLQCQQTKSHGVVGVE